VLRNSWHLKHLRSALYFFKAGTCIFIPLLSFSQVNVAITSKEKYQNELKLLINIINTTQNPVFTHIFKKLTFKESIVQQLKHNKHDIYMYSHMTHSFVNKIKSWVVLCDIFTTIKQKQNKHLPGSLSLYYLSYLKIIQRTKQSFRC